VAELTAVFDLPGHANQKFDVCLAVIFQSVEYKYWHALNNMRKVLRVIFHQKVYWVANLQTL